MDGIGQLNLFLVLNSGSSMEHFKLFFLLYILMYNWRMAENADPKKGDLRLVNGHHQYEGRVEFYRDGLWSTICDRKWDMNDGQVVCTQLGFGPADSVTTGAERFGPGRGFVLMDSVQCIGTEVVLTDCDHGELYVNDCHHGRDAGVVCTPPLFDEGDIRLINGASRSQGIVEVFYNNTWGTICDNWWDSRDADVACYQLGFQKSQTAHYGVYFGQGAGPAWYDSIECEGTEDRLVDCVKKGPGLSEATLLKCQYNNAGVTCVPQDTRRSWTIPTMFLVAIALVSLIGVTLNIRIRGRKCLTYLPRPSCYACMKMCGGDPQRNYPADLSDEDNGAVTPQYVSRRSDEVLDRDSFILPPPPSYDIVTESDRYDSTYGQLAMFSFSTNSRTNSDSGVYQDQDDEESLPSSPPPPYDSVSEYSRNILTTVHGSTSLSVGTTPVGTPITIRALRTDLRGSGSLSCRPSPFATPRSSPYASPQIHRAASRIWRSSPRGSPMVSPRVTPEVPASPPPPYSESDPVESITSRNDIVTMPSVE